MKDEDFVSKEKAQEALSILQEAADLIKFSASHKQQVLNTLKNFVHQYPAGAYPEGVWRQHPAGVAEKVMDVSQWERLRSLVHDQEEKLKVSWGTDLADRIARIFQSYRSRDTEHIRTQKELTDDVISWMRALEMYISCAIGEVHKEKDARLRGAISVIESSIQKLRDRKLNLAQSYHWQSVDVFRSDADVSRYIERIRELENELKIARGESVDEDLAF